MTGCNKVGYSYIPIELKRTFCKSNPYIDINNLDDKSTESSYSGCKQIPLRV